MSKLGGGWDNDGKGPLKAGGDKIDYSGKTQKLFEGIVKNLKFLGADGQILTAGKSGKIPPGQLNGNGGSTSTSESFRYFYHPDHLGSTSYVTDASGEVYQHLEYFAFGETFVEEHSNTDRTPYLFNGKELDEETNLYYFSARYYDPRTSVFLSVDPLSDKFPSWTPYNYAFNNPIRYIDPTGLSGEDPQQEQPKPKKNSASETSKPGAGSPQISPAMQKDIEKLQKFKEKSDPVKAFFRKAINKEGVSADNQVQRDKAIEKVINKNIQPGENGEIIIVMSMTKEDILNLKDAPEEIIKKVAGDQVDKLIEKGLEKALGQKLGKVTGKGLGVVFNVLDATSTGNSQESSEKTAQQAFNKIVINLILNSADGTKPQSTTIDTFKK